MKLRAVLRQRRVPAVVTGFCRTKFAPISKACCVVVFPFRIAKETVVLLLGVLRRLRRISMPPCMSSQSTITASNLEELRTSAPVLAAFETSTSICSFSRVGRNTRTTSASRLTSRDSRFIELNFSLPRRDSQGTKVIGSNPRGRVFLSYFRVSKLRMPPRRNHARSLRWLFLSESPKLERDAQTRLSLAWVECW